MILDNSVKGDKISIKSTNKKGLYNLTGIFACLVISACSFQTPSPILIKAGVDFSRSNLSDVQLLKLSQSLAEKADKNGSIYVADIGKEKKQYTGVSITFKVNPVNAEVKNNGLNIKNSIDGTAAKVVGDVKSYRFWLLHGSSPPTGDVTGAVVTGSAFDFDKSSGSVTLTYTNVNANDPGEKYYIAAAAYDDVIAATLPPRANIVNLGSGATISGANVYVSSDGGEGYTGTPASGNGRVFVDTDFSVSSIEDLLVKITLADAIGAAIESDVTVSNGSTTLPPAEAQ